MNPPRNILVIEDDPAVRRGVVDALQLEGYRVLEAAEGKSGLARALEDAFDLILLDLALPGIDGLAILRQVRAVLPTLPVIIITARGEESARVEGLRLGADDYVVKPLGLAELRARVEAVLRRSPQRPLAVGALRLPEGVLDLPRREIRFDDGQRLELSEREQALLLYLARHRQRAISREEILRHVWQLDPRGMSTRAIDMHITRLREKLRDPAERPCVLLTVRGQGYTLALPEAPHA